MDGSEELYVSARVGVRVADLQRTHSLKHGPRRHHDVPIHHHFELEPVRFGVALTVNDSHLFDEGALSRFTSACAVQWWTIEYTGRLD